MYFGTYRPSGDFGRASVTRLLCCTRYILDICAPVLPLDAFLNATPRTEKINAAGAGPLVSTSSNIQRNHELQMQGRCSFRALERVSLGITVRELAEVMQRRQVSRLTIHSRPS